MLIGLVKRKEVLSFFFAVILRFAILIFYFTFQFVAHHVCLGISSCHGNGSVYVKTKKIIHSFTDVN